MDVRVRHKVTNEISEMSEVSFQMLRHEYELAASPKPIIKPSLAETTTNDFAGNEQMKKDAEKINGELAVKVLQSFKPTRKQLIEKYESLFMEKPHGRMKDETIIERIKEQQKMMVDTSTGE